MKGTIVTALLVAALPACDKGFSLGVTVDPGCAAGRATDVEVLATFAPSGQTSRVSSRADAFFAGNRRVVVVAPAGATSLAVEVRALAGASVIASGSVSIEVSGHGLVEKTIAFATCGAADLPASDGATPDGAFADLSAATDGAEADLVAPDHAAADLAAPDLALPDLAAADGAMAIADGAAPDLVARDAAPLDGSAPDLGMDGAVQLTLSFRTARKVAVPMAAPAAVVAADLDGDKKIDLAVANKSGHAIALLMGKGDGTFTFKESVATGKGPVAIVAADFNGDGRVDLATANSMAPQPGGGGGELEGVTVLLNAGGAAFPNPRHIVVHCRGVGLIAADLDGDLKPDLLAPCDNCGTGAKVSILWGNGNGTFQRGDLGAGWAASSALGDFNGDKQVDLLLGIFGSSTIVYTYAGARSYKLGPTLFSPQGNAFPGPVAVGDLDDDGKLDAVGIDTLGGLSVALGNGNATFKVARNYAVSPAPGAVVVRDLDGDNVSDVALSSSTAHVVEVLSGVGDGTLRPRVPWYGGADGAPAGLLVEDLNADGKQDIAVANSATGEIDVLFGLPLGVLRAETRYSVGAAASGIAIGKLNGDEIPDVAAATGSDVGILLGALVPPAKKRSCSRPPRTTRRARCRARSSSAPSTARGRPRSPTPAVTA